MSFPSYVEKNNQGPYPFNTEAHYVDTFAAYTGDDAAARNGASSVSGFRGPSLQRLDTGLKILTCVFALAAILSTVFAKEAHDGGWTLDYTSSSSFVFFMIANAVVCVYSFVGSMLAIAMWIKGRTKTVPNKLLLIALILDVVAVVILLLGFASAMATEVVSKNGFYISSQESDSKWTAQWRSGVCENYTNFCTTMEVALGFSGAAIISFTASTAIDGYFLHLRGI